jgi:hypothetical protein
MSKTILMRSLGTGLFLFGAIILVGSASVMIDPPQPWCGTRSSDELEEPPSFDLQFLAGAAGSVIAAGGIAMVLRTRIDPSELSIFKSSE